MKTLVLLSGGLDSSVNLLLAKENSTVELALTIAYQQKAEVQELKAAKQLADSNKIPHQIVKIDFFQALTDSSLISNAKNVPHFSSTKLLNEESAAKVWVPNRNGLFINIAACFAEALGIDMIVTGFNLEEAETFPDNSKKFVRAINESLTYSTRNQATVKSYTQNMSKSQIVAEGRRLKLPFELIWSCYEGKEVQCGKCESCLRYQRAIES